MKFTLALLLVAAILGCVLSCSDSDFADFKAKFGKKYRSEQENDQRKKVFCENFDKIQAHNELFKKGESSYSQGVNAFADMTQEEFENSGYIMHKHNKGLKGQ